MITITSQKFKVTKSESSTLFFFFKFIEFPCKLLDQLENFCEQKCSQDFDRNCVDSVDQFGKYSHPKNIVSQSAGKKKKDVFPFFSSSLISFNAVKDCQNSSTSFYIDLYNVKLYLKALTTILLILLVKYYLLGHYVFSII